MSVKVLPSSARGGARGGCGCWTCDMDGDDAPVWHRTEAGLDCWTVTWVSKLWLAAPSSRCSQARCEVGASVYIPPRAKRKKKRTHINPTRSNPILPVEIHTPPSEYPRSVKAGDGQAVEDLRGAAERLQGLVRVLEPEVPGLLLADEDKVVVDGPVGGGDAVLPRDGGVADLADVDDERGLDAKDGVRGLVRITADVEGAAAAD